MTAADILAWVESHHGVRLNDGTRAVIRALVEAEPATDVRTALSEIGITADGARWRLNKKRLPPPQAWRRLSRALVIVRAVRDRAGLEGQAAIAASIGIAHSQAMHHTSRRAFGVPLARATYMRRSTLLARWYEREVGAHV